MTAEATETEGTTESKSPGSGQFWRWVRRFFSFGIFLILLGLLIAPWVASQLISGSVTEEWLSSQIPGNLKIGDASIGWQSPIMLNDVSLSDDSGKEIAQVKAVTSNQSFWDLFRRPQGPIELEFEGLTAAITVPEWKTTQQPATFDIRKYLDMALRQKMPDLGREMTIRMIDSRFDLVNPQGDLLNSWAPIVGSYRTTSGKMNEHHVDVEAPVATQSQNPVAGSQQLTKLTASWSTNPLGGDRLDISIDCREQPLGCLNPLLEPISSSLGNIPPITGNAVGHLERVNSGQAQLHLETEFVDFVSPEQRPPLGFDVTADYSESRDELRIDRLYAQVESTEVELQGEVTEFSGQQNLNLQGNFRSPSDVVKQMLPEDLRKGVEFTDLQLSELSMKGPLRPDPDQPFRIEFELSTIASWKEAVAYGLKSENGQVRITLNGNNVKLEPLQLPLSQGHIRSLPGFDLSTDPMTVTLEKRPLLDQVTLTEEVCREWLRYVSPLLSDATATEGRLSLIPEAGAFQFGKLNEANLSGTLQIQQGRVRPGPLAQELIAPVSQIAVLNRTRLANANEAVLMTINDQDIPWQIVEGRVYHADFNFHIGPVSLVSNGSVGFDQTLDLMVSMAFPENWTNRGPVLQMLRDESLDFHIVGTLEEPKLNAQALGDFGKRMGIRAAEGLLQRLLERRRDRLPTRRRD